MLYLSAAFNRRSMQLHHSQIVWRQTGVNGDRRQRGSLDRGSQSVALDAGTGDQPWTHLGRRLRDARKTRGLTQQEAATAAGLARNTLVSLERAQNPDPRLSTLLRLMRVYGLGSLEELLGPPPSYRMAEAWEAEGWTIAR